MAPDLIRGRGGGWFTQTAIRLDETVAAPKASHSSCEPQNSGNTFNMSSEFLNFLAQFVDRGFFKVDLGDFLELLGTGGAVLLAWDLGRREQRKDRARLESEVSNERSRLALTLLAELDLQSYCVYHCVVLARNMSIDDDFEDMLPPQPIIYPALADRITKVGATASKALICFYGDLYRAKEQTPVLIASGQRDRLLLLWENTAQSCLPAMLELKKVARERFSAIDVGDMSMATDKLESLNTRIS